jgi:hypothetical protein
VSYISQPSHSVSVTTQKTGHTVGSSTSPKNGLKNTAFWNVMICSRDKIKQKNKIERGEDIARNTTHQLCLKWVFRENRCNGGPNTTLFFT